MLVIPKSKITLGSVRFFGENIGINGEVPAMRKIISFFIGFQIFATKEKVNL